MIRCMGASLAALTAGACAPVPELVNLPVGSEHDREGGFDDAEAMRFVAGLGAAMASANYPVTMVRNTMVANSRQFGLDNQFLALPNYVQVGSSR
jgi:hypothetical protein